MRDHQPRLAESLTAYLPPEARSVPRCALPAGRLFPAAIEYNWTV